MNKNTIFMLLLATTLAIFGCSKDENTTINTNFQGNWEGTYTGDDYGTWKCTINSDGNATGSGYSQKYSGSFQAVGTCDNTGKITLGVSSTGGTFTGQITGTNISGTWKTTQSSWAGTGTFTGTKK